MARTMLNFAAEIYVMAPRHSATADHVRSTTACAASNCPGETWATAYQAIGLRPKRPAMITLTPPLKPKIARADQNTRGSDPASNTAVNSDASSCGAQ